MKVHGRVAFGSNGGGGGGGYTIKGLTGHSRRSWLSQTPSIHFIITKTVS